MVGIVNTTFIMIFLLLELKSIIDFQSLKKDGEAIRIANEYWSVVEYQYLNTSYVKKVLGDKR